ncbi:hypothetical protein B0A48_16014 [Cryoendolithus antarcticus]|uniref:Cytochrome P450 n=1 Tax=Cryoendolithus antarcticus TaxID=1507870 RepID=A0A1V8SEW9_9PEZI|nr:hypothetical protein B0A48_16014 [Cryoendolithus antarcticus]
MDVLSPQRLSWAIGVVIVTGLLEFWRRLHYHRSLSKNLPGPPRSYLFGHLISMGKIVAKQPKSAAPQTYSMHVKEAYGLGDWFCLDVWPLGPTILVTFLPEMMHEFTVKYSALKHPAVAEFMENFGGEGNLVSAEGATWKKWRSAFNPGFSASHLMAMVPALVDQCAIFCKLMDDHAKKGDLFRMEPATTRLTVDIIAKVVMDHDLNSQTSSNDLVNAFISQTRWQAIGAQFQPSELIDFRRPFVQRWNNYRMNRYIGRVLDERFADRQRQSDGKQQKHVIDLALTTYLKEVKGATGSNSKVDKMDPDFRAGAIANIKTFVFAGHDTTSSTICYCYNYLSKNPNMLAKIRAEHDSIFGSGPAAAAQAIKDDARLLNRLEYTTAVIKEVLRLQPPASSIRVGEEGFFIHDPTTGQAIHTKDLMLWPVDVGLHRSPLWGDPHIFRPERFLDPSTNTSAYVPFSKGPRNCIGQELAMIETKVILAMTVRSFDFEAAYKELCSQELRGDGSGYPGDVEGVQEMWGDEAYQIQLGTAKPREGMPCRLRRRKGVVG